MKLQIIYRNSKGFLVLEVMLAFSLFTLFTISTFYLAGSMDGLKIWSLKELDKIKEFSHNIWNDIDTKKSMYGNDSQISSNELFEIVRSDYINSWGRNSCSNRIRFDEDKIRLYTDGVDLGASNISSDMEVRNGFVYLSTDSTSPSPSDLYIIDARNHSSLTIISSLDTGPGISSIEVAGPYIFAAQSSTVNQLQVIDIHDRKQPKLISQIKLPLPNASTTAPFATSIFYSKGYIYLGTTKWNGFEFHILDVSNVLNPVVIGSFETNTLVNDIYVVDDIAYLATSDEKQMRVLDVSDKSNPILIDSFSPSGYQTQEGKVLEYFQGSLGFGRTVGGFNVLTNHELFLSSTSTISRDIPGGIYGILLRPPHIFTLTNFVDKEFQVFDTTLKNKIFEMSLGNKNIKMTCDASNIFFTTGNSRGLSILEKYE